MLCAIDTNLLIYFFDSQSRLNHIVIDMLKTAEMGEIKIIASDFIFAEMLAYSKLSDKAAIDIESRLKLLPINYRRTNQETFIRAAALYRRHSSLKLNDAIHLAAAVDAKADRFITNDRGIIGLKKIDGVSIVPLDA